MSIYSSNVDPKYTPKSRELLAKRCTVTYTKSKVLIPLPQNHLGFFPEHSTLFACWLILCFGGLGFVSCPVNRLPWLFSSCLQTLSRTAPLVTSRPRPWTSRHFGLPFDAIRYVLLMASLNNAPISGTIRWQHQPTQQTDPSQQNVGKKPPCRNCYRGHPVVFSELWVKIFIAVVKHHNIFSF